MAEKMLTDEELHMLIRLDVPADVVDHIVGLARQGMMPVPNVDGVDALRGEFIRILKAQHKQYVDAISRLHPFNETYDQHLAHGNCSLCQRIAHLQAGQPVKAGPELGEEITISKQSWESLKDNEHQS